jgi:hypothetical protein
MTETIATSPRRVWTSILVAVVMLVAVCLLAAIGLGVYVSYRDTASTFVPPQDARFTFDNALAGVAMQEPLVEVDAADVIIHRTPDHPRRELSAMHVLAYDPRAKKLVNLTVPGWLLRIAGRSRARLKISEREVVQRLNGQIGLDELERHGPGVVLDTTDFNGRRVLIWTE